MRNAFYEAMIMKRTNKSKLLNNQIKNALLAVLIAIIKIGRDTSELQSH